MGHQKCLEEAGKLFLDWINDAENIPHPDLRTLVYNYGNNNQKLIIFN